jgi:hypothetical protein
MEHRMTIRTHGAKVGYGIDLVLFANRRQFSQVAHGVIDQNLRDLEPHFAVVEIQLELAQT